MSYVVKDFSNRNGVSSCVTWWIVLQSFNSGPQTRGGALTMWFSSLKQSNTNPRSSQCECAFSINWTSGGKRYLFNEFWDAFTFRHVVKYTTLFTTFKYSFHKIETNTRRTIWMQPNHVELSSKIYFKKNQPLSHSSKFIKRSIIFNRIKENE